MEPFFTKLHIAIFEAQNHRLGNTQPILVGQNHSSARPIASTHEKNHGWLLGRSSHLVPSGNDCYSLLLKPWPIESSLIYRTFLDGGSFQFASCKRLTNWNITMSMGKSTISTGPWLHHWGRPPWDDRMIPDFP